MGTPEWIGVCGIIGVLGVVWGHYLGWNNRGEHEKTIRAKERELEIKKLELAQLEAAKQPKPVHRTKPWDCETR